MLMENSILIRKHELAKYSTKSFRKSNILKVKCVIRGGQLGKALKLRRFLMYSSGYEEKNLYSDGPVGEVIRTIAQAFVIN